MGIRTIADRRAKTCVAALSLMLAGCGGAAVDQDQDRNRSAPAQSLLPQAETSPPPAGNSGAPPPAIPAEPETGQGAEAAAQLVRNYYALIEKGDYAAAHDLWEGGGEASGMSAEAFAASFDRYAGYHAEVGEPGRIDAGAGQRYIEVPVTITGRLKDGDRPYRMAGALILHRNADIPGTTPLDRSWRIRDSSIRPRPAEGG